tara:strand:- start:3900 stop:4166 length:267 start_codon:yes stop_codon:yes gene_type:complete
MEQVVHDIIENIIIDIEVKEMLNEIKFNYLWINKYDREITKLKEQNKKIETKIYKTCNHNWERDWDDLYSRHKVCTKCKLGNFPYVYK